jgi:HEAT repeat protein
VLTFSYPHLLDVDSITLEECLRAARTLAQSDTWSIASLIRAADERTDSKATMRALEIVDGLGQAGVAAQWIRRLTADSDPNVRSKAVKILSTLHVNLSLIEKQLESKDPRVRANAVEGLWGENSLRHTRLLERAAKDPHHRVAANGLYGLYVAKIEGTAGRMIRMANSSSPDLRAAIAWAMGRTGSHEFTSELEKLAADGEESVRLSATRALKQITVAVG